MDEKVVSAVDKLMPKVEEAEKYGLKFGLYNHGGWGGLPHSMVRICKRFHELGHEHVGIVYNLHHAHPRIRKFSEDLREMKPYLFCVNLNGMVDPEKHDVYKRENKIRSLGKGTEESKLIAQLIESGYTGPVGILGHVNTEDVEKVLQSNLSGLESILSKADE